MERLKDSEVLNDWTQEKGCSLVEPMSYPRLVSRDRETEFELNDFENSAPRSSNNNPRKESNVLKSPNAPTEVSEEIDSRRRLRGVLTKRVSCKGKGVHKFAVFVTQPSKMSKARFGHLHDRRLDTTIRKLCYTDNNNSSPYAQSIRPGTRVVQFYLQKDKSQPIIDLAAIVSQGYQPKGTSALTLHSLQFVGILALDSGHKRVALSPHPNISVSAYASLFYTP